MTISISPFRYGTVGNTYGLTKIIYYIRSCLDWSAGMFVPWDIRMLYFIQCGLYVHSFYATFYMDSRRKDFYIMLLHHALTVALIFVSYATRYGILHEIFLKKYSPCFFSTSYHKVGLLVLFCHDATDICLEATKLMRYLAVGKNGQQRLLWKYGSYIGFFTFTCCW